jgi:23S rRNA pseudouridine1911/1915/1917 synthase
VKFVVEADEAGRIDRVLVRRFPQSSRKQLLDLFEEGGVRIGGKLAKKGDRVAAGAEVSLARAPHTAEDLRPVAESLPVTVLHTDDDVVVISKPAGMPSQPLRAGETGTAANAIVALHPECASVSDDPRDGGLVHRLDIGTSGVLIAARTREAWQRLREAFGKGEIEKEYLALVDHPPVARGCDLPLAQRGRKVAVDLAEGLEAHTAWEPVASYGERRLVRCVTKTGRMHQVRVHLAQCGAPIAGDELYGGAPIEGLVGFFLHAAVVRFPGRRGRVTVEAPLPPDRDAVLAQLRPR